MALTAKLAPYWLVDAAGNFSANVSGEAAPLVSAIDGFIVTSAASVPELPKLKVPIALPLFSTEPSAAAYTDQALDPVVRKYRDSVCELPSES